VFAWIYIFKLCDKAKAKDAKEEKKAPAQPRGGFDDLQRIVAMIERAVETNEVYFLK
jgi:hypothetical protein